MRDLNFEFVLLRDRLDRNAFNGSKGTYSPKKGCQPCLPWPLHRLAMDDAAARHIRTVKTCEEMPI
jgi:hypothetical protein